MNASHVSRSGADDEGDQLSRWKRIRHLDLRLRDGTFPSKRALARECGVSQKTIQRDIEAMRLELDAPITYEAARRGYRYETEYALPAASLSERDLFALLVAENAVAQYVGTPAHRDLRRAFDRILSVLPGRVRAAHELAARSVHFSGLPPANLRPSAWSELATAIEAGDVLRITYSLPGQPEPVERRVHPLLLIARNREWFLVAASPDDERTRMYHLPRILATARTGERFAPPAGFDPEPYLRHGFHASHGGERLHDVELRLDADSVHLAEQRRWSNEQVVERLSDTETSVRFRTSALADVQEFVLRHAGHVRVVGPDELRTAVGEAARRVLDQHA